MLTKTPLWLTIGEFAKFKEFDDPITTCKLDCAGNFTAGLGMYTLSR